MMSHQGKQKELLILILNYKNFLLTEKCVNCLLGLRISAEILIVDNASPNESYEELKKIYQKAENVSVVQSEKNGGYSYGNNFGIKKVEKCGSYKYICIMNPDIVIPENYFEYLCQILEENEHIAAVSPLVIYNNEFMTDRLSWDIPKEKDIVKSLLLTVRNNKSKLYYKEAAGGILKTEVLPGCFFVIKKEIFKEAGYFDENVFLYNEENILAIKLKQKGYSSALDMKHFYYHNHKEMEKETVNNRYRQEFQKVKSEYLYGYDSGRYLLKEYYHGKGLLRYQFVHTVNLLLLYLKRLYMCLRRW